MLHRVFTNLSVSRCIFLPVRWRLELGQTTTICANRRSAAPCSLVNDGRCRPCENFATFLIVVTLQLAFSSGTSCAVSYERGKFIHFGKFSFVEALPS